MNFLEIVIFQKVVDDEEEKKLQMEKKMLELKKFWDDVFLVLDKAPANSSLLDIARLEYTCHKWYRSKLIRGWTIGRKQYRLVLFFVYLK